MNRDNGGPAFPGTYTAYPKDGPSCGVIVADGGMTLRDWFAGHAPPMPEQWFNDSPRKKSDPLWHWGEASATWAYFHADAMLAARARP